MIQPLPIAKAAEEICLLPGLANRHGLIAGATGTGKTVTLQKHGRGASAASACRCSWPTSRATCPGSARPGSSSPKLKERLEEHELPTPEFAASPVTFWDVLGEQGHPVRATVSEMGPLLLSRMLNLNDTQTGRADAWCSRSPTTTACCCSTSRTCAPWSSSSATTPSSSPPTTATSRPPASARSSAACCRSKSRAVTSSSASPRSTSTT